MTLQRIGDAPKRCRDPEHWRPKVWPPDVNEGTYTWTCPACGEVSPEFILTFGRE